MAADINNDIAVGIITINNIFAHWIREIVVKRYGDDIAISSLTNTVDIYRYSHEILKYFPENALKTIENDLLYSKKSYIS